MGKTGNQAGGAANATQHLEGSTQTIGVYLMKPLDQLRHAPRARAAYRYFVYEHRRYDHWRAVAWGLTGILFALSLPLFAVTYWLVQWWLS
jgi:hypothetical protein